MNPRLPRMTAKELTSLLKRHGFRLIRSKGSHQRYYNSETNAGITVPVHTGKIIGPGLLKAILKQAGLNIDDIGIK